MYVCRVITKNNYLKQNIMRTYISIENNKSDLFEQSLYEYDLQYQVIQIRERDFYTDFIFEDLNYEETTTLSELQKNCLN